MPYVKRVNQFNEDWLLKYKWLKKHPTSTVEVICSFCNTVIYLGSIRLSAIESHRKGKKHAARETSVQSSTSIKQFFRTTQDQPHKSQEPSVVVDSASVESTTAESQLQEQEQQDLQQPLPGPSSTKSAAITEFLDSESILKAEILWGLHSTVSHNSFNSNKSVSLLFAEMFPDSNIAQKFTCGSSKMSYLVTFGLAPYFSNELAEQLKDVSQLVILFDESFNRVTKNEQMDIYVRYWSSEHDCVVTRYVTSEFLGHATAKDLKV